MATITTLPDRESESAMLPDSVLADDCAALGHRRSFNAHAETCKVELAAGTAGVPQDARTARAYFEYPLLAQTWGQVPFTRR